MKRLKPMARKTRTRRRPINVAASVLTSFGLYCGIASIFAAIDNRFERAAYFILAAIVFDMLDGAVAKLTHSVSEFGKQLDSLCDLVSFGVAPAALIYTAYLNEEARTGSWIGRLGAMMAIIFVLFGALRLARYNVYQSEMRDSFSGLPIPAAGGVIAAFVLFTHHLELRVGPWLLAPLTLALAFLMVSTIRYPKDRLKMFVLAPRNAFRLLILCVVSIAVFHVATTHSFAIALLPIGAAYVLFGLWDEIYARFLRHRPVFSPRTSQSEDTDSPAEP